MTKTPPAPEGQPAVRRRSFNARFDAALSRVLVRLKVEEVPHIKRVIITVVGGTVLLIGAAMVFLPGPGLLVMLGGLALLGTEYAWARRLMRKGRRMAHKTLSRTQKIFSSKDKGEPVQAAVTAEQGEVNERTDASESVGDKTVSLVR